MLKLTVALLTATMVFLLTACNSGDSPAEPTATPEPRDERSAAIQTVAASLGPNSLGIEGDDLSGIDNPNGDGIFVYVERTRSFGAERFISWLVLDGTAYALNDLTNSLIPILSWALQAGPAAWALTGLGPNQSTEAFEIVFGVTFVATAQPPSSDLVGAVEGVWYLEASVMRTGSHWSFCLELNEGMPSGKGIPLSGTLYSTGHLNVGEPRSVTGWLDPYIRGSTLPGTFTFGDGEFMYKGRLEVLGASGSWGNDPMTTGAVPVGGFWLAVRADRDTCE